LKELEKEERQPMQYGYFEVNRKEYIITRPDTPTPWMNYISNESGYCGIVSQTGGGFSFYKDPRDRRITKYRFNSIPVDRPGRYIYIKNNETGEYWSPTWQPVMKTLDEYECRHGLGYTRISSRYGNITHSLCYFVPPNQTVEIWHLRLGNTSQQQMILSLYPYSEFTLWSEPESRNIQWSLHLTRCFFKEGMIFYRFIEPHPAFHIKENIHYNPERPGFAFMGINVPVEDFDCVRDIFIGMYRSETNPKGVERNNLSGSILEGGIACAALRTVINLQPEEEKDVIIILGFAEHEEQATAVRNRFSIPEKLNEDLQQLGELWHIYLSGLHLSCPDNDISTFINVWHPYQCKTTFDWSRYISYYENGEGRGMGTRDSCQDALALCERLPAAVRKRIVNIISACQLTTGDCFHQFFPLGHKAELKNFSDDHLWLIVMTFYYIAESGDINFLKETMPYADSDKSDSLYTHLVSALSYTETRRGSHGLPLILVADWNDTLHLWMEAEHPESVFIAALYVYAATLLASLAERIGEKADAAIYRKRATNMSELVNETCWDGEWYIRGFGKKKIGTKDNEAARIFLNSQSWAVISGIAQGERAFTCMNSVRTYLNSPEGCKLIWPSFESYDAAHGLISRYVKGRKENGIFAHACAWAVIAEVLLERADYAYEYYTALLPIKKNSRAEVLKTEPYVYCQTICSGDGLNRGEGANSWLTGTASWMYIAFTHFILGIKPGLDGLTIAPCIPRQWEGFSMERVFRGCKYMIKCRRRKRKRLIVDGKERKGIVVEPQNSKNCSIDVEII
jgi:cellobiose phosphorylase